jgi:hypothetical protein
MVVGPKIVTLLALAVEVVLISPVLAGPAKYPVEVGPVEWQRDFESALADSKRSGKPVFAFFQEVPGCSGCKNFGKDVMSQPTIVQAIQHEFVPVLVYNNRGGKDAALLERCGEPAWNYQVVRFLDGTGADLIPRKDRVWTKDALSARMIEALLTAGRTAPRYLQALAHEGDTSHHDTAAFAQHCFWTGEFELGRIPGVIATEAGWLDGNEVTLITYHTGELTLESLVAQASKTDSALKVYLPDETQRRRIRRADGMAVGTLDDSYRRADDSDQKRQIRQTPLFKLDLSTMQQTKVNAFAPIDDDERRASPAREAAGFHG